MARGQTSAAARGFAAAAVIAAWGAIAALTWPGPPSHQSRHDHPPAWPAPAGEPLRFGPITYFNTSCGNCHGDYGMMLAEELDAALTHPGELERITREMVLGQAQSSLPDREIKALAAYRRSLLNGSPFIAWTSDDGGIARGEVTPGATVEIVSAGRTIKAMVDGHTWSATTPAGPAEVRATLGAAASALNIPIAAFTHDGTSENRQDRE